jgi:hypothetical protein
MVGVVLGMLTDSSISSSDNDPRGDAAVDGRYFPPMTGVSGAGLR